MQAPTFHVRTPDGRVWGPLTDAQVRAGIHSGGITANSFITPTGLDTWSPVWQHSVYGPFARAVARPMPPPGLRSPEERPRPREMTAGKIVGIVLGIVVLLGALCALPVAYVVNTGKSSFRALLQESEQPQVLVAEDGLTQLSFPGGWGKDANLNDDANLEASGHFRSAFALTISEPKTDFPAGTTLKGYSDLTQPSLTSGLERGSAVGPRRLTLGSRPALQYEVRGSSDGTDVVMLHHVTETAKHFHQVLVWTPAPEFAARKAELEAIAQSFREPAKR